MKAIKCEMCNSNDVIKQDGYFVCQSCGTKYTTEEAKKLLVEISGKVDVSGSVVKIDSSNQVENALANARLAANSNDWNEAVRYYDIVKQNDYANIEANFYSAFGRAKASLYSQDYNHRQAMFNVLVNNIAIIFNNFDVSNIRDKLPIITKMSDDIVHMLDNGFVYEQSNYGYGYCIPFTNNLFMKASWEFAKNIVLISEKLSDEYNNERIVLLKMSISHYEKVRTLFKNDTSIQTSCINAIDYVNELIKKLEPNFEYTAKTIKAKESNNGKALLIALVVIFVFISIFIIISISSR